MIDNPRPSAQTVPLLTRLRQPYVVVLLLFVLMWVLLMLFRWQLRAQWWAHQAADAETAQQRDFYVTRLASIRDKSLGAVPILLQDQNPDVRKCGVTVLRYCSSESAADMLMELLHDSVPEVAADAATTLAWRSDSKKYIPQLAMELNDATRDRWGAAVALGRIGGTEAEQALIQAMNAELDADTKAQVIDSLGMLGCEQAIPLIQRAVADTRPIDTLPQSQMSAQHAIAALQGDLLAKGADPQQALNAVNTAHTVSAVASRWLDLLSRAEDFASTKTAHP